MRVALIQLNSGDQPMDNLPVTEALIHNAAQQGASFVLTPEVTNIVSTSRKHQAKVLCSEHQDPTLARLKTVAAELNIWLLLGSIALKTDNLDGRFANRSLLIDPMGQIKARYDKIHMFDVDLSEGETWRESDGYRPGDQAVLVETGFAKIGMTICYDVRFPHLYRVLAQSGATVLTVPSAFSPVSGRAHWHMLLRARAIETGSFILAPAQCGDHAISQGKSRRTFGRSLIVSPWGEILAEGGTEPGIVLADIELDDVVQARHRVPSLSHDQSYAAAV